MIFYFSGTGNSEFAAKKLAGRTGEQLIRMSAVQVEQQDKYCVNEGERIGFVFPVYWYGIPKFVEEFVKRITFKNESDYVYLVLTYGSAAGAAPQEFKKMLGVKGMNLHAVFGVSAVDNYIVAYDMPKKEQQEAIWEAMEHELEFICDAVENCQTEIKVQRGNKSWLTPVMQFGYHHVNHTKKFWVDEHCVDCGLCEQKCPSGIIRMQQGKPVWNEENKEFSCSFCLGCIHGCPKGAIQYGKGTEKRSRYHMMKS